MKKNNSDTLKNQLNEKMDEMEATDIQKLRDEGKLNYTEKKTEAENMAHFSNKELEKEERLLISIRDNIMQSKQSMKNMNNNEIVSHKFDEILKTIQGKISKLDEAKEKKK